MWRGLGESLSRLSERRWPGESVSFHSDGAMAGNATSTLGRGGGGGGGLGFRV